MFYALSDERDSFASKGVWLIEKGYGLQCDIGRQNLHHNFGAMIDISEAN